MTPRHPFPDPIHILQAIRAQVREVHLSFPRPIQTQAKTHSRTQTTDDDDPPTAAPLPRRLCSGRQGVGLRPQGLPQHPVVPPARMPRPRPAAQCCPVLRQMPRLRQPRQRPQSAKVRQATERHGGGGNSVPAKEAAASLRHRKRAEGWAGR